MRKLVVFALLALSGCASDAELATRDDAKCTGYGAKAGDPAYVQCRAQLDAARTQAQATAAASIPGSKSDNTPQPEHTRY